jgi:group I intron endonuclease
MQIFNILYNDAPSAWQIGFQDSGSYNFTGIVELHDFILFFLVFISFGVFWILGSTIKNFNSHKKSIIHKYLTHGIENVPMPKYFNSFSVKNYRPFLLISLNKQFMSTNTVEDKIVPVKMYDNAYDMKKLILIENKNKSGIYRWTNKSTGDFYIGQSSNLHVRFKNYFDLSYLTSKNHLIICRALIKYGFVNFTLEILEYCDNLDLLNREQYYLDKLIPTYNILKIAGSSLGFKHSIETRLKISNSILEKDYKGDKSPLFGRKHIADTKNLMSLKKSLTNNPLFGKNHTEETKNLMSLKKLGLVLSEESKLKISKAHGNPVSLYEKDSTGELILIGRFVSARKVAKFIGISGSTVIRHMRSGSIYKNRYKFSNK